MNYKSANRGFLYITITSIVIQFLMSYWILYVSPIPIILNNAISEFAMFLPMIAVVLFHGENVSDFIPFKRIRIPSVLLTILYVFLLYPLVTLVNSISMLFVDNTVSGISDQIISMPMAPILFSIGIFGPFMEEIVFCKSK